jgi:hypothetical protein
MGIFEFYAARDQRTRASAIRSPEEFGATARRSLRGERRPLSSAVGTVGGSFHDLEQLGLV